MDMAAAGPKSNWPMAVFTKSMDRKVVALPGPDEDHNPETAASLSAVLAGRADIPASSRLEVARLMEDLTATHTGGWMSLISLHGGGSPEAMKREIWRNYPVGEKAELVEKLLDRGVLDDGSRVSKQPGRCCVTGCEVPKIENPRDKLKDAAE